MITKLAKCPLCGSEFEISGTQLLSPFRCPSCRAQLEVARSYWRVVAWTNVFISVSLAYALGFRGYGLLFATISILLPVIFAMAFVYKRFMPPKLKPYQPDYLNLDFLHQPP